MIKMELTQIYVLVYANVVLKIAHQR